MAFLPNKIKGCKFLSAFAEAQALLFPSKEGFTKEIKQINVVQVSLL